MAKKLNNCEEFDRSLRTEILEGCVEEMRRRKPDIDENQLTKFIEAVKKNGHEFELFLVLIGELPATFFTGK